MAIMSHYYIRIEHTGRILFDDAQGAVCNDVSCKDVLDALQPAVLSRLRHITFTRRTMFGDDGDNRLYAQHLGRLLSELVLDSITLAVPKDYTLKDDRSYETDWWMWTLHTAAIRAFTAGTITRVRFAHSVTYSEVGATRYLHYGYIEETALGEELEKWERYCVETIVGVREQEHPEPCPGTPLTLQVMMDVRKAMWKESGFRIEVEKDGENGEGTVLVLYRPDCPTVYNSGVGVLPKRVTAVDEVEL
jgi:hypothetical protein